MKTKFKLLLQILTFAFISIAIGNAAGTHQFDVGIFSFLFFGSKLLKFGMKHRANLALGIIDPTDLTFNGKEAMGISEGVYEKVFVLPGINAIHEVHTGFKAKTQIPFLGVLGLVGKKKTACDTTPNPGGIPLKEKFADPEWIADRFEECWDTLKKTFFVWGLKEGVKKEDLTDTDFANFLEDRITEAVNRAIYRIAHFGDVDEELVADGGNLVAGTDIDYFNIIDGLWKQAFDIATATPARQTTIAKNGQATYSLQRFNSTDTTNKVAELIFESLKYDADYRLRDQPDLIILCTQSLADQYAKELRSRNIDASYVRIEGGYNALMFEGIPIVPISYWDTIIQTYFKDGTAYHIPHRAILTTRSNLALITENESSLSELAPNYDAYHKKYFVDFGFMLDFKIMQDDLVQIAY